MDPNLVDNLSPKPSQEEEILELAKKELLREIKCASIRAEQFGAHSWAKPQKYVPSKRFLKHMIVNDSRFNDRKDKRSLERREVSRSRHSSSSIRHIEDQSEKSSKFYLFHSRHHKKRELPSEDEAVRNKSKNLYSESVKHHSGRKTFRKSTVFETYKEREKVLPIEVDRSIEVQREKPSSRKEKHSRRKKRRKNSLLLVDKESGVSSDEEDEQIQSMLCEKEKHSKRKKYRKMSPSEIDDKPSALHSKHYVNIKEMPSEDDKEVSSLSGHGEKQRKKHSKKKTHKRHK